MGTRATYEINGMVFYCHWDGYPAGAACRFANMIEALNTPEPEDGQRASLDAIHERRGGAAFAFIRGNDDAEPAYRGSHNGHGDTEWRYRVTTDAEHGLAIQLEGRRWSRDPEWLGFGDKQPLASWINAQRVGDWAGIPQIVTFRSPSPYCATQVQLATLDNARKIEARHRQLAERFDDTNPNRKGHLDQADAWARAIEEAQPQPVAA